MASSTSSSCHKRALESDSQTQECEGMPSKKYLKLNKVVIDLTVSDSDDEQDDNEPVIDDYQCSSSSIQGFGVKRFLIHHDYILFPYCFVNFEGKREKPTENRVSSIIQGFKDDCRYQTALENVKIFDSLLDQDTSERKDMRVFAGRVLNSFNSFEQKLGKISRECHAFKIDILHLMQNFKEGRDGDDLYRYVFSSFLRMLSDGIKCHIREKPNSIKGAVEFPMFGKYTEISGQPDIIIIDADGRDVSTVAVVKCKRYRETVILSGDTPVKDDQDMEKVIPSVRFCKASNTSGSCDDLAKKESILERMYEDLDASICRCLKREEKDEFGIVFAQLVGEVLAWFQTCHHTTGLVPEDVAKKKSVRYGIGQLGFKIFFITVGMNNSCMESLPHIRIGQSEGMGLDVFMTRPFDLMIADDRAKIRDILIAMMFMRKLHI